MATISPERWRQLEPLLDAVLECPASGRAALLDRLCAGDEELRAEVERLADACENADEGFLAEPAPQFAAPLLAQLTSEREEGIRRGAVGPYRVVGEVGRGGMGTVYLAERADQQFEQRVALKLVRDGLDEPERMRRFLEERQILASLEHPNIARLLDGGVTAGGHPYFAMEYVRGLPIDRYCDENRLDVAARLRLFCRVCAAVQYAHRNLVVHRDLKPTNILVGEDGEPKLLDFGIAKLLAAREEPGITREGFGPLTPEYASPEQVRGDAVSTASDVYSLGVLLYSLLSGHLPHRRAGLPPGEVERRMLEPPERPSQAVLRTSGAIEDPERPSLPGPVSHARGTTPERLRRRLRGDLDTIVLRALHPEPERRYPTVGELADDVRRHLDGLAVRARPDTRAYRARKFVTRHRWGVAAGSALVLLLVGFSTVTAVQGARIRESAARVAEERDRAQQGEAFLLGLFARSDPYAGSGEALSVRELLDNGVAELQRETADRPDTRARMFLAIGMAYYGLGENERAAALMDSSYTLRRGLRGETDPETIATANQLANVLRVAGRYDEAAALYQRILAARRSRHGDGAPEVARALNGLALVRWMQGRSDEAERLLREALVIDRRDAAVEPAHLAQTLNNLGHAMRDLGALAEAEALHRESLAVRRAFWGQEHFEVSVSLSNLAGVLRDRGDLAGADTLYRQVLDLRRRLVGEAHPDLAYDRAGYALLLHRRGDLRASDAMYRRALDVQLRALPPGHPLTAVTLTGHGLLLLDMGRPAEAEPLLSEALAARRRALTPGHWRIAETERALEKALERR